DTAISLQEEDYGESFNIGSGCKTTIGDVAAIAKEVFEIETPPVFTMPNRQWDVRDWFANPARAKERLSWQARTGFRQGLCQTIAWYRGLEDKEQYHQSSKKFGLDTKHSVTAIIACYKDNQAIPIMYERLKATFAALRIEHEIIFVNDN